MHPPKAIEQYGINLFNQLFTGEASFHYRTLLREVAPENILFEIIGQTPAFQSIYWESLKDPSLSLPLAIEGAVFRRKNTKSKTVKAVVNPSPTINLLIVTARPNGENDVNYRTIQRPLIELIQQSKLKIKPHILRPGTYEAFVQHLDGKAKYYHIIHFDLHGALLDYATYQALQKEAVTVTFTNWSFQKTNFQGTYALPELPAYEDKKAFLFFESTKKGTAIPVEAGQLGAFLENRQIPIVLLNACQSAKQTFSEHETSLGQVLIQKGIQLVLAMRYSVSVSAAKIFMDALYQKLYQQIPIEKAIVQARKELHRTTTRKAAYNRKIDLQDWLLPVVYQNGHPNLRLRDFTPEEELNFVQQQIIPNEIRQSLPHGFFGRDLDMLRIEKALLTQNNLLLLQGMGGAGKTTLLKYLGAWWLKTGFIQKVFYFGYELKAFTLADIIRQIAQSIYGKEEYESFRLLHEDVQKHRIKTALNTSQYALILDNAESITGVNLAIKNTLTKTQRTDLKLFLTDLKGGKSIIIIGSRSPEAWLKSGTFENNHLGLRGLDEESAKNFADTIIRDMNIPMEYIAKDQYFERLLKLLDGFPLALKAILPNLKTKTAKVILGELEKGLEGLDTGKMGDKTESIVKCIEYAYSNLSEEAKNLLIVLSPFRSIMNLTPRFITVYVEELKKSSIFKKYQFHKLNELIQELQISGLITVDKYNNSIEFVNFQPLFTFFLKDLFKDLIPSIQVSLNKAFINYYKVIGNSITYEFKSNNPERIKLSLFLIGKELSNLSKTINLLLQEKQDTLHNLELIARYFVSKQQFQKGLDFLLAIEKKIGVERMNIISLGNYVVIKNMIGVFYQEKQLLMKAKKNYHKILLVLEDNSGLLSDNEFELFNAVANQNLGIVNKILGDYDESAKSYLNSLAIYEKHNIPERKAEINQNLGNIYRLQNKYEKAKKYINKSLKLFLELRDEKKMAENCHNLALIESGLKNYEAAEKMFLTAIEAYEKFNDTKSKAEANQDLGSNYLMQKKFSLAKKYLNIALELFVYSDFHQGKIFLGLGIIEQKNENYKNAKLYYMKGLEIALKYKDYIEIAKLLNNFRQLEREEQKNTNYFIEAWEYIKLQINEEEVGQIVNAVEHLAISKNDILDF